MVAFRSSPNVIGCDGGSVRGKVRAGDGGGELGSALSPRLIIAPISVTIRRRSTFGRAPEAVEPAISFGFDDVRFSTDGSLRVRSNVRSSSASAEMADEASISAIFALNRLSCVPGRRTKQGTCSESFLESAIDPGSFASVDLSYWLIFLRKSQRNDRLIRNVLFVLVPEIGVRSIANLWRMVYHLWE